MNAKDCLEAHMHEDGFNEECREQLEHLIERRSSEPRPGMRARMRAGRRS